MAAQLALDVNGCAVVVTIDVLGAQERPGSPTGQGAAVSTLARHRRPPWAPAEARKRIELALLREASLCPAARLPELAAILAEITSRLTHPTKPPAALQDPQE